LLDSYHCSRYNTNTGVLTPQMFRDVIVQARKLIDAPPQSACAAKL
jgi:uracil-DNA glycosylase